jgi:hypothetical protein
MRYLRQGPDDGMTCWLFALCNAARYYGLGSPRPGSKRWRELCELGGCIAGSCIDIRRLAKELGLKLRRMNPDNVARHAPAILNLYTPDPGHFFHASLVIGGTLKTLTLVNYQCYCGPTVEQVPHDEVDMPAVGNVNRKAWSVRLR